ncbi:MAG: lipid IV(A) 3-deoxy-D-manno-octulosonic acid transferase [Thiobacillaceae bacterium]
MNVRLLLEETLYRLVWLVVIPVLPARLLWRGLKEPGYLHHWAERFGGGAAVSGHPVWIHAVSVGEMRAAAPLVFALRSRYPGIPILLTCMTATGRDAAYRVYGDAVVVQYAPYDYPRAVKRFLRRNHPRLVVVMETEIWPVMVSVCDSIGIPIYLANARLSAKSARGYGRVATLMRATLGKFAAIAAQYQDDARRLETLGARKVVVTGSLKFDLPPAQSQIDQGRWWRQTWGSDRPVILAASTREGEEELILKAFAAHAPESWLLVLVPRHPQRFDEVAALIAKASLCYQRRSQELRVSEATRVMLGDTMGEMISYYGSSDIAFIGGSLLPYGGQNLVEAMACGVPVLMGPHMYNFTHIAAMAEAHGAARRINDADGLIATARDLIQDKRARETMSADALKFAQANRGAIEKLLAVMSRDLDQRVN